MTDLIRIPASEIEEIPAAMLLPNMRLVIRWDDGTASGDFKVLGVQDGGTDGVPVGYVRVHAAHWGYFLKANDDVMAIKTDWVDAL